MPERRLLHRFLGSSGLRYAIAAIVAALALTLFLKPDPVPDSARQSPGEPRGEWTKLESRTETTSESKRETTSQNGGDAAGASSSESATPDPLQTRAIFAMASDDPRCARVTAATCSAIASLGRGINFGNMLEGPKDGSYGLSLKPEWIELVREAGFTHIRLPVRWSNHAAPDAEARLDEDFVVRVERVMKVIEQQGMSVVVDMHHYRQLDGDPLEEGEARVDEAVLETRAENIWRQLAKRWAGKFPRTILDLYNEPHERLDGGAWNRLHPKLLAAVRAHDAERTVLIGPEMWNNVQALKALKFPDDRNVALTVHLYDPHEFTHQNAWGAKWKKTLGCCDGDQKRAIERALDTTAKWSRTHGRPVYVGEWGVHVSAPAPARVAYARTVRELIEARGMPWAWWGLGSDFAMRDMERNAWIPGMLEALMDRPAGSDRAVGADRSTDSDRSARSDRPPGEGRDRSGERSNRGMGRDRP